MTGTAGDVAKFEKIGFVERRIEFRLSGDVLKIKRPANEMIHCALGAIGVVNEQRIAVCGESFGGFFQCLYGFAGAYALCCGIAVYRPAQKVVIARITDFFFYAGNFLGDINKTFGEHGSLLENPFL